MEIIETYIVTWVLQFRKLYKCESQSGKVKYFMDFKDAGIREFDEDDALRLIKQSIK